MQMEILYQLQIASYEDWIFYDLNFSNLDQFATNTGIHLKELI